MLFRFIYVAVIGIPLAACASGKDQAARTTAFVGDVWPTVFGGMPSDVPPRPGTPEYDAWQAERAAEAARPKNVDKPK